MEIQKKYNYGLGLLKAFMSFEVICIHFLDFGSAGIIGTIANIFSCATSVFMLLAFYFSYDVIFEDQSIKFKKRIARLLYLQISWSVIYYLVFLIAGLLLKKNVCSFTDFIFQLLTGSNKNINPTMWFQIVLLLITLIIRIVYLLFKDKRIAENVVYILGCMCLYMYLSGIGWNLSEMVPYELKYIVHYFFMHFPLASIGIFFKSHNILEKLNNNKIIFVITIFVCVGVASKFPTVSNIVMSILLVTLFNFINQFINDNIVIKYLCMYTTGCYCMHRLVERFIKYIFNFFMPSLMRSIIYCLVIYITCWIISYFMYKSSNKYIKYLVI